MKKNEKSISTEGAHPESSLPADDWTPPSYPPPPVPSDPTPPGYSPGPPPSDNNRETKAHPSHQGDKGTLPTWMTDEEPTPPTVKPNKDKISKSFFENIYSSIGKFISALSTIFTKSPNVSEAVKPDVSKESAKIAPKVVSDNPIPIKPPGYFTSMFRRSNAPQGPNRQNKGWFWRS